MIPVLYKATATEFTSCGLGELAECISFKVTSRKNGMQHLDLEYPADGIRYPDLAIGRLIKAAEAPDAANIFCIEDLDYSTEGVVKIYAPQETCLRLSKAIRFTEYDSSTWSPPEDATGNGIFDLFSGANGLRGKIRPRLSEVLDEHGLVLVPGVYFTGDFTFPAETELVFPWSSKTMTAFEVVQTVAEVLGGEIKWGFNRVDIVRSRGTVTGLEIRYGVNMLSLEAETDGDPYATAVMPEDSVDVDRDYIQAASPGIYPFFRIATAAALPDPQLKTAIKVEFDPEGHANVEISGGDVWSLRLCDTVTVVHPAIALKQEAQIVETVFGGLLERYESMSVGEILKDITDTIAALIRGK